MRKSITKTLSETKSKYNGYTALLNYRYGNLCIEADPQALLPVTIKADNAEQTLEEVAYMSNPQKDQFAIYPKDQYDLPNISGAIMQAHPEFKMEIKEWEDYPEELKVDGEDYRYLLFTMPEVNKDRRDLLNNGVKALHEQWDVNMQAVKVESSAQLAAILQGQDKKTIDNLKGQLEDFYKTYHDMGEGMTEDKLKEIEQGYERYLKHQEEQGSIDMAQGENSGMSMQMGGNDD